jgi:hypothetical protein
MRRHAFASPDLPVQGLGYDIRGTDESGGTYQSLRPARSGWHARKRKMCAVERVFVSPRSEEPDDHSATYRLVEEEGRRKIGGDMEQSVISGDRIKPGVARSHGAKVGLALSSFLIVGAFAFPAGSHVLGHTDPDDVGGRLDMRTVEMDRNGSRLKLSVISYERFTNRDLYRDGFYFRLDSRGDHRFDFRVWLGAYKNDGYAGLQKGHFPHCVVYDRSGEAIRFVEAEKSRRSLTCAFRERVLRSTKHVTWWVTSTTDGGMDRAPDLGRYRH